jgi:hypothetical protein
MYVTPCKHLLRPEGFDRECDVELAERFQLRPNPQEKKRKEKKKRKKDASW